jgi:hypothetical protein
MVSYFAAFAETVRILQELLTPKNVTLKPFARISYGRISSGYAITKPCL